MQVILSLFNSNIAFSLRYDVLPHYIALIMLNNEKKQFKHKFYIDFHSLNIFTQATGYCVDSYSLANIRDWYKLIILKNLSSSVFLAVVPVWKDNNG